MRNFLALILVACAAPEAPPPEPLPPPPLVPLQEEPEKDEKKWDVEQMPGPTVEIDIDVTEGTWMSLDVSPDGKTIVFDLLGDLYTLPIAGGEAKSLTRGVSWDIQPRFSPDGAWIAFVSDRDGMDNVWLVSANGEETRQITKEKVWEMSEPSWSPDGRFVLARKHITTERSIGAGEIWLYHRSGGAGLMMTKRQNDQKDVGEPIFSPDGKYIYFSQDSTPGKTFEYNKNPHATIYTIKRLTPETQRIETFVSRSGGAAAPAPSHDGKSIAYVGRKGLKTALFVEDIASGDVRMLSDGLDRDMQETWAVHGVYPSLAWLPDDSAILFWAGGKIRRVDVKSGVTGDVPFSVKDKRKIHEAVRFPVEVHPAKVKTKMLRGAVMSPDGRTAVFQALGQLYVKSLPDGAAKRLTSDDVFEQHPAFSRDGRWIVYTTWDDSALGSVRIVSAKGGRSRVVTKKPGHYAGPAFSPDGSKVVYRNVGWHVLRPKRYTRGTGIYVVEAKGGTPRRVSRAGGLAHFGTRNDRIFFMTAEGEGEGARRILKSVRLDGSQTKVHMKTKLAHEIRVSPDEKWVAWRESYAVYAAPFSFAGQVFELGPTAKSVPVIRASKDSGAYLHFSSPERLHWSMGPELFTRDLSGAIAELEEDPEEKPEVPESGIDLGFEVDADVPKGSVAFTGARIVTMKGDEVVEGTLLVEGNRITGIGQNVTLPPGTKSYDVKGMTIVPGFVDVHHHGPQAGHGITPQANWALYAMLAFGTTTVHDPSHDTPSIFSAAELARTGRIVAPRIFSTGSILYGADYPLKATVDSLDDAMTHLRRMKSVGAVSVKSYRQRRRAQRQQILTAARELKMMVLPEGGSIFQHNMNMVVDGHTGIEHAVPIAAGYDDVIQLWKQSQVGYTPTTVVGYGGIWGENYWYQTTDVFAHPRLTRFVPAFILEARARRPAINAKKGDWNHVDIAKLSKKLSDAGVVVNVGAHGQREGLAVHWEMWMMAQGGMSPLECLRTGTLNGARYLGMDEDIGSIEVGKLADLAIIDGDVLRDIRQSEKVRYTVINGRVYDAATLNQLHPTPTTRPKFWFEGQ